MTPQSENDRRAAWHRVIGALTKQLEAIGHAHDCEGWWPGYCTACDPKRSACVPVATCAGCKLDFCGPCARKRVFLDDREEARYFRLRSKIRRLSADLAQGRLFVGGGPRS